ncbi:MAG: HEAT repeat domain-containing protein [Planctomycetes bacterium]|nr:HEAT repeat domain-containing protein [Planctomycetota bacterium]
MLVLSLICFSFCCLAAVRGGVGVLSRSKASRSAGWLWLLAAPSLGVGSVALYEASPQLLLSSILKDLGLALMLTAAVVAVLVLTEGKGRLAGRRLIRSALAAGAVFGIGYGASVWTEVARHGWWAGVPTTLLVLLSPWLPERAMLNEYRKSGNGSLETRMDEIGAGSWRARYLQRSLERRYRNSLRESDLQVLRSLCGESNVPRELAQAHLNELARVFCESSDEVERRSAASVLEDHCPFGEKISRASVGAEYGTNAFRGRLPRLLEMARNEDWWVGKTAIEAVGYFGNDAAEAVPLLIAFAKDEIERDDWYRERHVLEYLAQTSPVVCDQLRRIVSNGHGIERLIAYEALRKGKFASETDAEMQRVFFDLDDESALCAFRSLWLWRDSSSGIKTVFEKARRSRERCAEFLLLLPEAWIPNPDVLLDLKDFLNDPSPHVRASACEAIAGIGRRQALGVNLRDCIQELRFDPDSNVRTAAENAWRQISSLDNH